tara:strand:+ start:118 stop:552 length:435 start_codon:yes stop_codon:yes gene_type:complete
MARASYLEVNSGASNFKLKVENIAAARTLTAADSGKVFILSQADAYSVTLPTAAAAGAGWSAKFVLGTAGSNAVEVIPNSAEDTLIGTVVSADGAAGASAESGVDQLIWVASTAAVGDSAEIVCDGLNFYVSGQMHDAGHITLS